MKKKSLLVVLALSLVISGLCFAQSYGGDFSITKSAVVSGGGMSAGGDFSLVGSIGQAGASVQVSSGGQFNLAGGFWAKAWHLIFHDSFETR